jgi:hypothetical protein
MSTPDVYPKIFNQEDAGGQPGMSTPDVYPKIFNQEDSDGQPGMSTPDVYPKTFDIKKRDDPKFESEIQNSDSNSNSNLTRDHEMTILKYEDVY